MKVWSHYFKLLILKCSINKHALPRDVLKASSIVRSKNIHTAYQKLKSNITFFLNVRLLFAFVILTNNSSSQIVSKKTKFLQKDLSLK